MGVYGVVWGYRGVYGVIRACMGLNGVVWGYMGGYGVIWGCMGVHWGVCD